MGGGLVQISANSGEAGVAAPTAIINLANPPSPIRPGADVGEVVLQCFHTVMARHELEGRANDRPPRHERGVRMMQRPRPLVVEVLHHPIDVGLRSTQA